MENLFKGTKGKWEVNSTDGKYFHIDANGERLLSFYKPKRYTTDYVTRIDEDGCEITTLSDEVAARHGKYVATEEVKKQVEKEEKANAYLVAAAPDLLDAAASAWVMLHDIPEEAMDDYIKETVNKLDQSISKALGYKIGKRQGSMADYHIKGVNETKIMDVFLYNKEREGEDDNTTR